MRIPFENVGQFGILSDIDGHKMVPGAWTSGKNVRFREGRVERFWGHQQVLGTPGVAPYWAVPVVSPAAQPWWVYAGLQKVYAYDGTSHHNITRQTTGVDVNYTATATKNWTGGVLGGIAFLSNGVDAPQKWATVNSSTKLTALDYVTSTSTWESLNYKCASLRSYLSFLVALDVTKGSTRYPQMVKWSHPAATGTVPASWDETDTSKDAGEYDLAQTNGACVDGLLLRDINVVYKEDSVWGMQFVGGAKIFRFWPIFRHINMLSRRCGIHLNGKHYILGAGDIVVHDGQNADSLVDQKMKRNFFNRLAADQFQTAFTAYSERTKEVWFCIPETGQILPNIALVLNLNTGVLSYRDLPSVAHIEPGPVSLGADSWDADSGTWSSETTSWGETAGVGGVPRLLMAAPNDTKFYSPELTTQFAGSNYTAYVERLGVPITFNQKEPPDFTSRKFIKEIWPQFTGTYGGVVNVYLGSQERIDGPISWGSAMPFTIGVDEKVEPLLNTRIASIKFESTGNVDWALQGFTLEAERVGRY